VRSSSAWRIAWRACTNSSIQPVAFSSSAGAAREFAAPGLAHPVHLARHVLELVEHHRQALAVGLQVRATRLGQVVALFGPSCSTVA